MREKEGKKRKERKKEAREARVYRARTSRRRGKGKVRRSQPRGKMSMMR